jgi:hypothetical protein
MNYENLIIVYPFAFWILLIAIIVSKKVNKKKYKKFENEVLLFLGIPNWNNISYIDDYVVVKSRQALENYYAIKFFKEDNAKLDLARSIVVRKNRVYEKTREFYSNEEFKKRRKYKDKKSKVEIVERNAKAYRLEVQYITSSSKYLAEKIIELNKYNIDMLIQDPTLLMGKSELNKYKKEQQKAALEEKQHEYYEHVNDIVDYANNNRDNLVIKGSQDELDKSINQLFDRTVNSIKKIKTIDSEEWDIIGDFISRIENNVESIISRNQMILDYYESSEFQKIKDTCKALMDSQREFNDYINEKVQSISKLFGTKVVRTETTNTDVNDYIRPYKKTITPFTAEVSATVFASAENNPLEYVVKNFYPNKKFYPEQIQKLYLLVEELETLRDAKQIIENYKAEYQQYLGEVPDYVMENDESGFYSRLGFANIDESVLAVEYKFSYTSNGGMAQRSFTVPMTEDTIAELIKLLESKLTAGAFAKEQRRLMTKKLREFIKERDNYTCCLCGNSVEKEPNLLLEIDHIIPVAKGGCTTEDNLQTLCWKCNRSKSDKLLN